jgi:hypothetical protein
MQGMEINATWSLVRRQFKFFFEKPDLRIGAPAAKDFTRRQGRCSGTVPDQAPAAGEILARETGILKKAPDSRPIGRTAEQARRISLPTRRGLQQAIEQVGLVAKHGGIARLPSA